MLRLSLTNGNANVTIGMSQSRCCDAIKTEKKSQQRTAGDGNLFTKCLQIHTMLFAGKMSVVK